MSVNGAVELVRRRYGGTGMSVVPADRLIDALEKSVSVGCQEFCCRVGLAGGNFDRAAETLGHVAGVRLSGEKLRQIVEGRGRHVQQSQRSEQLELDWSVKDCRVQQGPGAGQSRVYLGVDGVMVGTVTQAEKRQRRTKVRQKRQKRGKRCRKLPLAKSGTDQRFKELKIICYYDQQQRYRQVAVTAGNHAVAGKIILQEGGRILLPQAQEAIGNVDGAEWIALEIARKQVPLSALGLDFYHFAEHVHQAKRAVYGEKSEQGDAWAGEMLHTAKHEGYEAFWERLLAWRGKWRSPAKRKAIDQLVHYVSARREMIRYPQFQARGWQIGSGPTEAMCKALTLRLKGRGMRWDHDNAEAMMALEALWQSGQWQRYWDTCAKSAA